VSDRNDITTGHEVAEMLHVPAPTAYRVAEAINAAVHELCRAAVKFPPMHSAHEGYAVILEELDELWHEVKHGTPDRAREEAAQVAAMALRFLVDIPGGAR